MRRWATASVLLMLLCVGAASARAPTDGLIAFSRPHADGSAGTVIWTMRPDGSGLSQLTPDENDLQATDASFSPSGDRLAYWQNHRKLIVMNPDGSSPRTLTAFGATAWSSGAAWDPLSPRIVFTSYDTDCQDCPSALYAVKLDGSGRYQVRIPGGHAAHATFAPNGRQLIYDTSLTSCSGIYGVNRPATKRRTLIAPIRKRGRCLVASTAPSFAPDGHRLAFVRWRRASNETAVFTLDLRSHQTRRISPWRQIGFDNSPSWSADGRFLAYDAFTSGPNGESPRYVFRVRAASGAKPQRLASGWSPTWQH